MVFKQSFLCNGDLLVLEDLFHLFSHPIVILDYLVLLAVVGAAEGSGLRAVQDLQQFDKGLRGLGHQFVLDLVVGCADELLGLLVELGCVGLELVQVFFDLAGLSAGGKRGRLFLLPGLEAASELTGEADDAALGFVELVLLPFDDFFLFFEQFLHLLVGMRDIIDL